LSSVSMKFT